MKKLFISALAVTFSINTFASSVEWREIESKQCGDAAPIIVKDEAIAILPTQSLVAFKKKDEAGCNYADFYSVLIVASGTTNGKASFAFTPVQAVSRKNCRNEMSPAPAPAFTMIQSYEDTVLLNNSEGCEALTLKLKPKAAASENHDKSHVVGPQE